MRLNDPLLPYLVEIVSQPEADGIILSGGFGMRLKQAWLKETGAPTLIESIPEARATQDLDIILNVGMWLEPDKATAFRAMLERLGYQMILHGWHLRKPFESGADRFVKLDLQARSPKHDEAVKVRDKPKQVGKEMGTGLSGLETPEAFAVDEHPQSISIEAGSSQTTILVPHPYAWLNLKVAAAYDWLREKRGDPEITSKTDKETGVSRRLKHLYDVYVLTAMLTEQELAEAQDLAAHYTTHPIALTLRERGTELFASPDAIGIQEIQNLVQREAGASFTVDHALFWDEGLKLALGI